MKYDQVVREGLEKLNEFGICVYRNFRNHPNLLEKFKMAYNALELEYQLRCQNPNAEGCLKGFKAVFKREPQGRECDPGDGNKKIRMISKEDPHSGAALIADYMYSAARVLDPDQCVVQGQLNHGECGDPVMQSCLLEDKEPKEGYNGESQDEHVDIIVFHTPTGEQKAEGMQNCNLKLAVEGGVNSHFFDFHGDYSLAIYPGMHKLARECLIFYRENHQHLRKNARNEIDLQGLIIDGIVRHLEKTFSDLQPESLSPVFFRCLEGDIIRINSILPHYGLPLHAIKKNIRGFLLTSKMVVQDVCSTNWKRFDFLF